MAHSLSSGSVTLVSGAAQWQGVMEGVAPTSLLVAMFGLSSDTVCTSAAAAMQVRGVGAGGGGGGGGIVGRGVQKHQQQLQCR
jgi:hypothetical protein